MNPVLPYLLLLANALPGTAKEPVKAPVTVVALAPRHMAAPEAHAVMAAEPEVIVPNLIMRTRKFGRYNPPGAKEPTYNTSSWVPDFEFYIRGPLEGGSQIIVNFQKPGTGANWLSLPCETPEIAGDDTAKITCPSLEEQQAITAVGEVPFQIILKNGLTGAKKVLFSGKVNVKKFKDKYDPHPAEFEYFVDQDWWLPMGFLVGNTEISESSPMLEARIWVKNVDESSNTLAAYILYNGKPIASSKHTNNAAIADEVSIHHDREVTTAGMTKGDPEWRRLNILCIKLRLFGDANSVSPSHYLDKNPGVYEIKLLRNSQPVCSAKFTVGPDGKIVDDGRGKSVGTKWIFMPVHQEPVSTPPANLSAYKTDAFYGHPLPGFVAP